MQNRTPTPPHPTPPHRLLDDALRTSDPSSNPVQSLPTASEEEVDQAGPAIPETLSILPLRDTVIFPGTVVPVTVKRASSLKMLDETLARSKIIGVLTQRQPEADEIDPQTLYRIGVAVVVLKLVRQSDDSVLIIVQGLRRIEINQFVLLTPICARR